MNSAPLRRLLAALAVAALAAAEARGQTARLPAPGRLLLRPAYNVETFDQFRVGKTKLPLRGEALEQTLLLGLDYGLAGETAADLTVGYDSISFSPDAGRDKSASNLTDTWLGIRRRLTDEFRSDSAFAPTLAGRLGGIINTSGDSASGFEASLLAGKALGAAGLGFYGDAGYRFRPGAAPEDLFGSLGAYKTLPFGFILSGGYRASRALTGRDIAPGDFALDPSKAALDPPSKAKRSFEKAEAGLGYAFPGGHYAGVYAAWTLSGRNVGQKTQFGFSAAAAF